MIPYFMLAIQILIDKLDNFQRKLRNEIMGKVLKVLPTQVLP